MKSLYSIILSLLLCISVFPASARDIENEIGLAIDQLRSGIEQLEQGSLDGHRAIALAAAQIESIIQTDNIENPDLYHALGNAYMLNDQVGYAVLAYRRGWMIDPNHRALNDSLSYARSRVQIQVPPDFNSKAWDYALLWRPYVSRNILWLSFVLCFSFGWLMCIVSLHPRAKGKLKTLGAGLILAALLPFGMLASEWYHSSKYQAVVIVQSDTVPRSGPDDRIYDPVFAEPLVEGLEGKLLGFRDSWAHLELPDGSECWVPEHSIEMVNRSF